MQASGTHSKSKYLWLALLLAGLALIGYSWATWRFFTSQVPGGNDFLTHYGAWQAYFFEGYSPYSEEAAIYTQRLIYGRPALPGEDQNRMAYPFYSILLHGPFVWIDYELARAIYMVLLQVALFTGANLMLQVVGWRPPAWLLMLTLAWILLDYPQARGVILGQFAIFGFFSLALTLYWLKQGRDAWAGIALTLSTMKPTLVFLVIPFLLLWAVYQRRWRFVAAFLGGMIALVALSFLILPSWLSEWFLRIARYSEYTVGQSPVWLLTHQALPALGQTGELVLSALLLLGMLWAWLWGLRRRDQDGLLWALGITLVVSNLVVSRSATTNYVLMLVSWLWLFARLDQRRPAGRRLALAWMLISFVGMWWLHFATVVGNQEQAVMFLPEPLGLGLALLIAQKWLLAPRSTSRNAGSG